VSVRPDVGNELVVFSQALPIIQSGNPGSFDFASYAKLQGILMQAFVSPGKYKVIKNAKANSLKVWLLDCRKAICAILKKHITGPKESGLAEALLVGYKEDLDKDLLQSYSKTGVVHVIAISGLHLGILYIICKGILGFLPFFRNSRWMMSLVIIIFLWLFSLLTGGSPSVLRSAVMFTAILVGESFTRKISIYNCLAASAFILLSYNPYWIFDIGFQLSYSAVLSILVFNKAFQQLLYVKNKMLDKVWQMVTVTLAAQVLTTPVSLFYFNQFPNYFLIANLVVVPLSSAVLIGAIFLCMISFLPYAPFIVGSLLTVSIRLMNGIVEHINQLPFSLSAGIHLSWPQVLLFYSLLSSVSLYLFRKRKIYLLTAQLVFVGLAITNLQRKIAIRQTQLLIVYNIKGKEVIEILNGRKSILTGVDWPCFDATCRPIINATHTLYGITKTGSTVIPDRIVGKKACVYFIQTTQDLQKIPPASIVILSSTMAAHAETLCRQLRPSLIVLDASHSPTFVKLMTGIANKHSINIYAVSDKGAFVMNLN
jgi:competence protein ComEC